MSKGIILPYHDKLQSFSDSGTIMIGSIDWFCQ